MEAAIRSKDVQRNEKCYGNRSKVLDAASDFVTAKATSAALGVLGGNVSAAQLLARQTGQIFNPNMELLFNESFIKKF